MKINHVRLSGMKERRSLSTAKQTSCEWRFFVNQIVVSGPAHSSRIFPFVLSHLIVFRTKLRYCRDLLID